VEVYLLPTILALCKERRPLTVMCVGKVVWAKLVVYVTTELHSANGVLPLSGGSQSWDGGVICS